MRVQSLGQEDPLVDAPHSYHRAHQCLEQEDWEMAVLFFSRALHLDPQLVRGRVWVGTGSCCPTLTLSPFRVTVVSCGCFLTKPSFFYSVSFTACKLVL